MKTTIKTVSSLLAVSLAVGILPQRATADIVFTPEVDPKSKASHGPFSQAIGTYGVANCFGPANGLPITKDIKDAVAAGKEDLVFADLNNVTILKDEAVSADFYLVNGWDWATKAEGSLGFENYLGSVGYVPHGTGGVDMKFGNKRLEINDFKVTDDDTPTGKVLAESKARSFLRGATGGVTMCMIVHSGELAFENMTVHIARPEPTSTGLVMVAGHGHERAEDEPPPP